MKYLINLTTRLKEAIKRGILRIFPLPLKPVLYVLLALTILTFYGCSTTKVATQTVERVSRDTIYLNSKQYDSIYIYQERTSDFKPSSLNREERGGSDTVYIKDVSVEYRYKYLHDTLRVIQRDTIPYEVTITEVKEITRPLTAFDHICRFCFAFLLSTLFVGLVRFVFKLKKLFAR